MKSFKWLALSLGLVFIAVIVVGLVLKTNTGSQLGPALAKLSGKYKDRIILKNGLVLSLTNGWYSDSTEKSTFISLKKLNAEPFHEIGVKELPQVMNNSADQNCSEAHSRHMFNLYQSAVRGELSTGKVAFADTHKGFYDSLQIDRQNLINEADLKWCETVLMDEKKWWTIKLVSYVATSNAGLFLTYGYRTKKTSPESEKELIAEILSSVSKQR